MTKPCCYVVLGPFRSGTSLVARLAATLGADAGPPEELFEPSEWNPAGYIQRPDITAFNKALLVAGGGDDGAPPSAEAVADAATPATFAGLDRRWLLTAPCAVVKDPRFCFTLLAWLRHGAFGDRDVRLILTSRDAPEMIRSALSHYDVKHYCGNSPEGARRTLAAYAASAEWHAIHLGRPVLRLAYELLDRRPEVAVEELAAFMEVADAGRIAAAKEACVRGRSQVGRPPEA